jgi:DNA gyrase subunit A
MIAIQTSERNGKVVGATLVSAEDEIMLITSGGVLIRTRVNEIREMGRSTQGVTLINLSEGEKLSGLERIMDRDEENGENGNGNGNGHGNGPIEAGGEQPGEAGGAAEDGDGGLPH